jgi:formylglycine-generating enzyme required for sulfatase activity
MGSDKTRDPQAQDNETPRYVIAVGACSLARFPVTVAEYACAVRANVVREPSKGTFRPIEWKDQLQRLDHPVVCVSWQDAVTYTAWLATLTGQPWRLPTEAEWEKAARGVDGRLYPWGNQWDKTRANTNDGGPGATMPVGHYPSGASPYGAYDLAGNVWVWTSSLFKPYPYTPNDGRERPDSTGSRVLRGGSWVDPPQLARAACRYASAPVSLLGDILGFRLAVTAPDSG